MPRPRLRSEVGPADLRRGRLAAAVAAFLLLAPVARPVAAQRLLELGAWTGLAELRFDVREQETDIRDGRSTLFDREVAEERLALRNTLTLFGRKFLIVNFGFTLGLTQSDVLLDEQQEENGGSLEAFDLTATLRPVSRHAVTLLASRAVTETPIDFVGTRELRTGSLGINVGVGPGWLPGSIRVRESELRSTSDLGLFVRAIDQRRRRFEYTAADRWPRHQVNLSYLLEDLEDRVAPNFSHLSQSFTVSHGFEVLAPRLATLRSVLRYYDRGGSLATSSLYLDEVLRLQHRRNLSTSFRYLAQQLDSFSGPPSDSQQLTAEVNYRLYDSLETDLFLTRSQTTSPGGRTDLEQIGFDATYTKKLPGRGELRMRLDSRYDVRDSLRGDGQELVRDERHSARFGVPVRLERPGVIPESVVVTDSLRAVIYEQGVDYELLLFGDFAEITPLEGGRIRDGDTILVEYRVAAPGAAKYTTRRDGLDLSLDYGWIAPFWGLRSVDTSLVEGVFDRLLEDQNDEFFGVRFRLDGRRLSLVSFNELRRRDSSLQSFESLRLGQNLNYRPWRRWTVRLQLAHLATDFTFPLRETRASEGRLRIRWAPNPTLSLESYAGLRATEDTLAEEQTFERYGFEGRWTFGKIIVLANVENWQRGRSQDGIEIEQISGLSGSLRISRRIFPGRLGVPRRRQPIEPWPANLPGLWSDSSPPEEPAGELEAAAIEALAESVETSPPEPETTPPAASGEAEDGHAEVARTVEAWARAWADQRAEDYLAFYAEDFRPPERFADRGDWERRRRLRLKRPRFIGVELSALAVETLGPDRARARFTQRYRSDVYADVVDKTLELKQEDGRWKLLRERVAKPAAGP